MKPTLLVLALVLVGGLAVWFGRSGTRPERGPIAPASGTQAPAPAGESAKLESEGAGRKPVADPAAPGAANRTAMPPPPPPPLMADASAIGAGQDGSIPISSDAASGTSEFDAKYANVPTDDLKATYQTLRQLYDENNEGRVQEADRKLTAEGMAQLEKEIAWLKEKAYGGG